MRFPDAIEVEKEQMALGTFLLLTKFLTTFC